MSSTSPDNALNPPANASIPDADSLRNSIAALGARPFHQQVVQSPLTDVLDADEIHQPIKTHILDVIDKCDQPGAVRCLTAYGPAGYGKTHLLAWTRQELEKRNGVVFVHVPPYTPESGSLEQHVLRAALDALHLRSQRQADLFAGAVHSFLVDCYDRQVTTRRDLKGLNAGRPWAQLLWPNRLKIGRLDKPGQVEALQRAFHRRARFAAHAFADFQALCPVQADGTQADRDTFVAACLLTCGDLLQRYYANCWFREKPMPPPVREQYHLLQLCQGTDKICNGLHSLSRLAGQKFCLAFDQIENTYHALDQAGETSKDFWVGNAVFLSKLIALEHFSLLFMFQESTWLDYSRHAPPMLRDRMTQGFGAQALPGLDATAAQAIVRKRMEASVWCKLAAQKPPADQPLFPFTENDVRQMRIEAANEWRGFLQRAQQQYEQLLNQPAQPPKQPPIELTGIEPSEVMSHERKPVLIHGKHFPSEVQVLIAGHKLDADSVVCRSSEGMIDLTTPLGLVGLAEVCVRAADDPTNEAKVQLLFIEKAPRKPYAKHIDRKLLRQARERKKLTQEEVARNLGYKGNTKISQLELGKWDPPDEVFDKMAKFYDQPLSSFFKQP